jgi:hypothetical protein
MTQAEAKKAIQQVRDMEQRAKEVATAKEFDTYYAALRVNGGAKGGVAQLYATTIERFFSRAAMTMGGPQ